MFFPGAFFERTVKIIPTDTLENDMFVYHRLYNGFNKFHVDFPCNKNSPDALQHVPDLFGRFLGD